MTPTPNQLRDICNRHADSLKQLHTVYQGMDDAYTTAARSYGFECRGCDENCCLTRFYHHTLVETVGLFAGYRALPEDKRRRILKKARAYDKAMQLARPECRAQQPMCPLNVDTKCILYRERPMICRLHGIPHVMRHPMKGVITGTGCHIFEASYRQNEGHPLDRTPIYKAMAQLEQGLRRNSGIGIPVRLTVAQMILCFEDDAQPDKSAAV